MEYLNLPPEKKIDQYVWNWKCHLGTGAFGKVYLGKDKNTSKLVAIKIIETSSIQDDYWTKSLMNEIEIMKELKSPNIVSLNDVFFTKNNVYIVTEFCNGGDLRSYLCKQKNPIPEEKARIILKDIIIGFRELVNKKVIHRDLKPENILINDNIFKLGDFGFSKHVDNFKNQMLKTLVGTPLYMSPQILKHETYTTKSDVWSLGLIFYEMIFGKTPWPAHSQYELVKNITETALKFPYNIQITEISKTFIKQCLEIDEEKRLSWEQLFDHKLLREPSSKLSLYEKTGKNNIDMDIKSKEIIQKLQKEILDKKHEISDLFKSVKNAQNKNLDITQFVGLIKKIDPKCCQEEAEYLFFKFDVNQDNTMSLEEFQTLLCENDYSSYQANQDPFLEEKAEKILKILRLAIQKNNLDIDKVFSCFDKKKNSHLDFKEFEELLQIIDKNITQKEVEYVFKIIDKDGSESIDKNEFREVIEKNALKLVGKIDSNELDEKANKTISILREIIFKNGLDLKKIFKNFDKSKLGVLNLPEFNSMIKIINPKLSEEEIKYIFSKFDLDQSKTIDIKEFEYHLTK